MEPIISSSVKTSSRQCPFSAEEFTIPFNRTQLLQMIKEKGVQDIMNNTTVDPIKNQSCIEYLYKPNLPNLGENYYSTTKRIHALHIRISNKPKITAEMNKYIQQQTDNRNYMKCNM